MNENTLLKDCGQLHHDWQIHVKEIARLTEERTRIHQRIRRLHKDYEAVRQVSRQAKETRELSETEWMGVEQQIDRLKEHLERATNSKEAVALEASIANLQPKSDALAAAVEQNLKREETARARTASEKQTAIAAEAELKENDARLADLVEREQKFANALEQEHIAASNRLEKNTRLKYDWLIGRHGDAVATIQGESCSGCGSVMPPAIAQHAKASEDVTNCPHCSRFFVKAD